MDKMSNYRQIVKDVIVQYSRFVPSHGNIRLDTLLTKRKIGMLNASWLEQRTTS
jgi:hypothetical protein